MEIGEVESELNRVHYEFQDTRELLFSVLGEIIKNGSIPSMLLMSLETKESLSIKLWMNSKRNKNS